MGARIDFTRHIHISKKSSGDGVLKYVGYKDITPKLIDEIAQNERIKWIQIDENLPNRAYQQIDRILERRPDIYFRIFEIGICGNETFDLSVLSQMPHLSKVRIDGYLAKDRGAVNPEYLCQLPNLKGVHLTLFDRLDYSFIKDLSPELEELILVADTTGKTVQFDCEWLVPYKKLHNLDFITSLVNLETLKLQDLKHITTLPDLGNLTKLKDIQLDNVPVDLEALDESVRKLVHS